MANIWITDFANIIKAMNPLLPKEEIQYQDTPMFIAALFTIAKRWKQANCPPMDKWINKK